MPIPVISIAQMREWECATWATGQTETEVIRRVGQHIARRARKLTRPGDSILFLAGKGHNGDDARAAAGNLDDRHADVLEILQPENDLAPLEMKLREKPALIVDGLFGIGLNRPLSAAWQKIIAVVNAGKIPILAVDVPSGLNADTGETFGTAIEATVTLTVAAPKTGMLAFAAWPFIGRLEVANDVGLIPCPHQAELNWTLPEDFDHFPPPRPAAGHKGNFGHAAIIAGSMGFHGAAVLAARGAQRAQAGLVTVLTQENVYNPIAAQLQSAMVDVWKPGNQLATNTSALLAGPGLSTPQTTNELRPVVRRWWLRHWWRTLEFPFIVDAGALDQLSVAPFPQKFVRVLTPHPGEAARLLNSSPQKVQTQRLQALRELSQKYDGAWVVLKGYQTLIGQSEGKIYVNSSGNSQIAQGGSGDLLSGFIAGLLAQPALWTDVSKTLRYAVWQHGAAADKLSATSANWTIEDLAAEIGNAR
jgi:NAD(P)H-hydrate epimerase